MFLLLVIRSTARPLYPLPGKGNHGSRQPLQTFRPYNIAHRGSNGELPEETHQAYMVNLHNSFRKIAFHAKVCTYLVSFSYLVIPLQRAIEEGADFIETDILSSKDGVLVCFHDVILDDTTNVANYKEFADRKRIYEVQGVNTTGYFIGRDAILC